LQMWPGKSLDREPSRTQEQACLRACTKALNRTLNHQFHRSNTTNLLPFMTLCSKALPSKQPFAARSPDIFLTCVPTDEVIVVFGQIPIFGYDGAWIFPPCRTLLPNPVELKFQPEIKSCQPSLQNLHVVDSPFSLCFFAPFLVLA